MSPGPRPAARSRWTGAAERSGRVAWATALVMSVALAASASAQPKIPPDYAFPQGKDSPGVVTFSHLKHKEKVEKCQGCHTKIFKMKKSRPGAFSMQEMRAGDLCGACHNGRTEVKGAVVFDVDDRSHCERCHKKE